MYIDYRQIGSRIQQVRKERGLTQEQLAERMSVSVGYISQLERGITKINLDTLGEIASILNQELAYFVSGVTPQSDGYLCRELAEVFTRLDSRDRQVLLTVANALSSRQE